MILKLVKGGDAKFAQILMYVMVVSKKEQLIILTT
jgi:hypothetical protein